MIASDLIRRLHQHRMWVNQRLIESVNSLSNEQLHRRFEIGQGSVWRSLTHLLAADFVWLEALLGNEQPLLPGDRADKLPGNQEVDGAIQSLPELIAHWNGIEQRWRGYLNNLSDDSLEQTVFKVSTSSGLGKRFGTRRADVLLHVCTHAQYTVAQLVNMLRQLGQSSLPEVMMISLARSEGEN